VDNTDASIDADTDTNTDPLGTQENPAASCLDILRHGASTGTGEYWLKPGTSAFQVTCEMTIDGGGWTQLVDAFTATLMGNDTKQYLYTYSGRWYESPLTTLAWTWTSGHQLTGTYRYDDGATTGSFSCAGSPSELPQFGIGCSDGPGPTRKVLPIYSEDPTTGTCEVCQDQPNAFGVGACTPALAVSVFVR
jgi:hypothetical protein